jgi:hypothetical protein
MSLKEGGASGKVAAVNMLAKNKNLNTIPMLEFALQHKHSAVRADFVRNIAAASIIRLSAGTSGV